MIHGAGDPSRSHGRWETSVGGRQTDVPLQTELERGVYVMGIGRVGGVE